MRAGNGEQAVKIVTPEDYLVEVTRVVCAQYPATGAALSEMRLVFGSGVRRRSLDPMHRVWGGGVAEEPLALVEIATIRGVVASGDVPGGVARAGACAGARGRAREGVAARGAPSGAAEPACGT